MDRFEACQCSDEISHQMPPRKSVDWELYHVVMQA